MEFTRGQAIDFIEKVFGQGTESNAGLNLSVVCPRCALKENNLTKKKLVIRTDTFVCHCWVCGYKSRNLINLLGQFQPHLIEEFREKFASQAQEPVRRCFTFDSGNLFETLKEESTEATLPPGFRLLATSLSDKEDKVARSAWNYLQDRGLTEADLWYWKIGITDYKPPVGSKDLDLRFRVIIPSFDKEGKLSYFSARTFWKEWEKYRAKYTNPATKREKIIFNELHIDWKRELTLVEGIFDLVKCNENATCVLGSYMDPSYALFQKILAEDTPVLLAFDADVVAKTYTLANQFVEYGITVRILHIPPGVHDVGEMTKSQFISHAKSAKLFTSGDYFRYKLEML